MPHVIPWTDITYSKQMFRNELACIYMSQTIINISSPDKPANCQNDFLSDLPSARDRQGEGGAERCTVSG